jgi:hypothetical protein
MPRKKILFLKRVALISVCVIVFLLILLQVYFLPSVSNSNLLGRVLNFNFDTNAAIDTGVQIIANEFNGDTTDFSGMDDEALSAIFDMVLEREPFGKIFFLQTVNLTSDAHNDFVDLDSNIEIAQNSIEVNITALTSLNKSAVLYFYGLTFSSPRVLLNNALCNSPSCTILSYSGGILIVSVSNLGGVYRVEETSVIPSEPATPGGGGGGGGIVSVTTPRVNESSGGIYVSPRLIALDLLQAEGRTVTLEVYNPSNITTAFSIELLDLDIAKITGDTYFILNSSDNNTIQIHFYALSNAKGGVYTGSLRFRSHNFEYFAPVIIEIKEQNALFDLSISLPDEQKQVYRGEQLSPKITIINVGRPSQYVDVHLTLIITDLNKSVIYESSKEVVGVYQNITLSRKLILPQRITPDQYLLLAQLEYENNIIESHVLFEVLEDKAIGLVVVFLSKYGISLLLTLLIIVLAILILYYRFYRRWKKRKNVLRSSMLWKQSSSEKEK